MKCMSPYLRLLSGQLHELWLHFGAHNSHFQAFLCCTSLQGLQSMGIWVEDWWTGSWLIEGRLGLLRGCKQCTWHKRWRRAISFVPEPLYRLIQRIMYLVWCISHSVFWKLKIPYFRGKSFCCVSVFSYYLVLIFTSSYTVHWQRTTDKKKERHASSKHLLGP